MNCSLGRRSRVLPAHAVKGLRKDLRGHAVLVLQDEALLQRHRHCSAVLRTFTAGEANSVQSPANLRMNSTDTVRVYGKLLQSVNHVSNGLPDLPN